MVPCIIPEAHPLAKKKKRKPPFFLDLTSLVPFLRRIETEAPKLLLRSKTPAPFAHATIYSPIHPSARSSIRSSIHHTLIIIIIVHPPTNILK